MSPQRWTRLQQIFLDVIERPPDRRSDYITAACGGDAVMETELRRLVAESETVSAANRPPAGLPDSSAQRPCFQSGEIVGDRFHILRFIARGGMGEVYEAYDSVLREAVALKTIRAEIASESRILEQFKLEVRETRKISSPHVCRIYDLFTFPPHSFLTMELLSGETLASRIRRQGRLSASDALPILTQLAQGLAAAHREGIVHRDFKSGNVMLTREQDALRAVITDFGLAHRTAHFDDTAPVLAGGTPAYMAPEQVEGKSVTPAADVYALGVVAFQMVSGRLPFDADNPVTAAVKRLRERPPAPSSLVPELDSRWDSAILRCLERDPVRRFAAPEDFIAAIESPESVPAFRRAPTRTRLLVAVAALVLLVAVAFFLAGRFRNPPAGAPVTSIAVLPFENLGPGAEQDYFTDGFTEELIHALSRIPGLRVIARESSFRFKRTALAPREIGERLRVGALLTGTIRRFDGRIRIIAHLAGVNDGFQLWSQDFNRAEKDLFAVQDQISREIAGALQLRLAGADVQARGPTPAMAAYDLYWMGRFHWRQRTDEGLKRSLDFFQQAIARDPGYAPAYSGLADAYCVMAESNTIPAAQALQKAKEAATHALALDPALADAYVSLGQVASLYDRDFSAAERDFRQALALNPNLVTAHQWYSYMLVKQRRFEDAMRHARLALDADPLSTPANINYAVQLFYRRDYDHALEQCRKLVELDPKLLAAHILTAHMLARKGRAAEAFQELDEDGGVARDHPWIVRTEGEVNAILGKRSEAESAAARLIAVKDAGGVPASFIAIIYATLGDRDEAFRWLDRAYEEFDGFLSMLEVYPAYDTLRSDPRYPVLLHKLGLK